MMESGGFLDEIRLADARRVSRAYFFAAIRDGSG
jgi:hypothetical protein